MKRKKAPAILTAILMALLLVGLSLQPAWGIAIYEPVIDIPKIDFIPSAPSDMEAELSSNITVKLTWEDNSSNETGFVIQRRVNGTTYANDLVTLPAGTTSYTDQLTLNYGMFTPVFYQVRAINGAGNSAYSNEARVDLIQPGAPTGVSAVYGSNNAVNLVWNSSSPELTDYFVIHRKIEGGTYANIDSTDDSHYIDSTVIPGNTYFYRIEVIGYFGGSTSQPQGVVVPEAAAVPEVPEEPANGSIDVSAASDWAEAEILEAYAAGLTTDGILNNFGKNITRREFSAIAVKLYEALSGETALVAINNPFMDTADQEVLKAFELGIIKGTSDTTFSPEAAITRQEICVMITRALKANDPALSTNTTGVAAFADQANIANWAMDSVKFASKNGIMKGTGGNMIMPLSNTSREQAIVLLKRTYESFK